MIGIHVVRLYRKSSKIFSEINEIVRFYCTFTKNKHRNVLKLHERGMYQELFPDTSTNQVTDLLNKGHQCVYAGFDPTANSLHVGNLLVLMNLLHWQRGGHKVFVVLGGATGLIGDPSHRFNERIVMEDSIIDKNMQSIKENIIRICDNHEKYFWQNKKFPLEPITILNNIDWYTNYNIVDFIKNIGKYFRLGTMLCKSSVQSRLKSDDGMSFAEFTYQILQAYDWLYLLKKYNCRFQIGGSDQLGNISAGHELISRVSKKNVFGLTLPLITAEGGKKFGKSLGNAVWLSPKKSSSFEIYQYFIRTTDADVENYLKLFTFLPITQINHIIEEHKNQPQNRKAQKILAENVTLLVHGDEGLLAAQDATLLLYDKSLESLSTMSQDQVALAFDGANVIDLLFEREMTIFDLAMKANCFKSEKDAIRIIQAGGFYVNYEKITNITEIVKHNIHILQNDITLLRTGKKTYHVVRWLQLHRLHNIK